MELPLIASSTAGSPAPGIVPWPWPLAPALIALLVGVAAAVLRYAARHAIRGLERPGGE